MLSETQSTEASKPVTCCFVRLLHFHSEVLTEMDYI